VRRHRAFIIPFSRHIILSLNRESKLATLIAESTLNLVVF
jgi:hypothetical protein